MASEKILGDAYRAADQLVVDATTDADAKLRQARFSAEARAPRDATYSAAGDARKFAGPLDELRRAAAPAVALPADDMRREIDATPPAISKRLSSMAAEPTASSRAC